MTTIASIDGILQPRLQNRFSVVFTDEIGAKLDFSDIISRQVVSTTRVRQSVMSKFGIALGGDVTVRVEDDAFCLCSRAVQKLFTIPFGIHINQLDRAGEVIFSKRLVKCSLNEVLYAENDYTSNKSAVNNLQIEYASVEIVYTNASSN